MTVFLNYFSNENDLRLEFTRKIFFAIIDMDYENNELTTKLENLS